LEGIGMFGIFTGCANLVINMGLDVNPHEEEQQVLHQKVNMIEINQPKTSETELEQQQQQVKALKYKKQRQIGLTCITSGALICVLSCLFTFFHDYSAVYVAFSLYGMTMVGACIVLVGLAFVFGI
jgi:hypothetical protein